MSFDQSATTFWRYNWEGDCACSGNGTCGKNPNDNDYNPVNPVFRKFYWESKAGDNPTDSRAHPDSHNCVQITSAWGLFIF